MPYKFRRVYITLSFVLFVLVPTCIGGAYLYLRAADQYHSSAAFSIRSEDFKNPLEALSAFTQVGATSTPDSAILYGYIQSQPLVKLVNARVDFGKIFNRSKRDFIFSLGENPSIEAMLEYWERMVSVSIDSTSGVLELNVKAFSPQDSQIIAEEILLASSNLVNELNRVAREDAMKFASEDLLIAENRLRDMRIKIRTFRTDNQIIDPESDVISQIGVVSALQTQLALQLVEKEIILSYAKENDVRIINVDRKISAIRAQIAAERSDVSKNEEGARSLSSIIGEFEELLVDLEFSQNAYTLALASEEQARAEARRKSRYVVVHIPPTIAEESIYPQRELLTALIFVFLFSSWSVVLLIYYNIRDRS